MGVCACHNGYCQCLIDDTGCIAVVETDPYQVNVVIDPDEANLASSSPAGLKTLLPREFTNPPAAQAKLTEKFSVRPESDTQVPFDLDDWDTFGMRDATVLARFTARIAGLYVATAHCRWTRRHPAAIAGQGDRRLFISRNGIDALGNSETTSIVTPANPNAIFQTTSGQVRMEVDDYLVAVVFQDAVGGLGNLELEVNNNPYTGSLSVCRIGGIP
jgi:hypothetical protein